VRYTSIIWVKCVRITGYIDTDIIDTQYPYRLDKSAIVLRLTTVTPLPAAGTLGRSRPEVIFRESESRAADKGCSPFALSIDTIEVCFLFLHSELVQ